MGYYKRSSARESYRVLAIIVSIMMILASLAPANVYADETDGRYTIKMSECTVIGTNEGDNIYYINVLANTTGFIFDDFEASNVVMIAKYDQHDPVLVENTNSIGLIDSYKITREEIGNFADSGINDDGAGLNYDDTYGYLVYTEDDDMYYFMINIMPFFKSTVGSGTLSADKYAYYDYYKGAGEYPMYTLDVPSFVESITLTFGKPCLVYNYKGPSTTSEESGNNYLAGWVEDYTKGMKEVTVKVDSNNDGEPDYIQVQSPYNADYTGGELLYAIKLVWKETLSASKISNIADKTYTGKAIKPAVTVKNQAGKTLVAGEDYEVSYANNTAVGKAKVTIKGLKYYDGTVTKTFKINPKSTTLKSVKAGKKSFTATWNKNTTQTSGYQLRYSLKSSMSGSKTVTIANNKTTSKTVKSLKAKKKYYVQVRTYKTVSGAKYYSSWSSAKSVKTK